MSATAPTSVPAAPDAAPGVARPTAVRVAGVSKAFRLPHEQVHTLKERALHPFRGRAFDALRALEGVSFDVAEGEFFGVVGRNGSGKSTLLRCLAGIYQVDAGEIAIAGRVSPFIELGVGFNPELTARDNVILNALMLGLTREEAEGRFDDIIAFAELEDFLDLRLKNYSSGMQVRLGFSVAIQAQTEVLLVDEVLAVGDAAFQQKCHEQFHRMKAEGRTVVFVTHDMGAVERFCDRALLLERGQVVELGEPAPVARHYNALNFGRRPTDSAAEDAGVEPPSRGAHLLEGFFDDGENRRIEAIGQGERLRVGVRVRFDEELVDPIFVVALRNEGGALVQVLSSNFRHGETGTFAAGSTATVFFAFPVVLAQGRYQLSASVARNGPGADVLTYRENAATVLVHGLYVSGGLVDPPHQVGVERG